MAESILLEVYQSRQQQSRSILSIGCRVCSSPVKYIREEEEEKGFCSKKCNKAEHWFSSLFPLGHKRAREMETLGDVEGIPFMLIPQEVQALIILMIFDYRILSKEEWVKLTELRRSLPGLTEMINSQVIPQLRYVYFWVLSTLPKEEIDRFRGIVKFRLQRETSEQRLHNWPEFIHHQKHLTTLSLGITYSKLEELQLEKLPGLTSLRANDRTGDTIIEGLSRLRILKLNTYSGISNEGLLKLSSLTALRIQDEYEGDITLGGINLLHNLLELQLTSQKMKYGKQVLDGLPQLTELDISGNDNLRLKQLTNLSQLKILRNNTSVTFSKEELLRFLPNLTTLQLRDKSLFSIMGWRPLGWTFEDVSESLQNLTTLDISDSNYENDQNETVYGVNNLIHLRTLIMSNCTGFEGMILGPLTNLTSLAVPSDMEERGIRNLSGLTSLNLNGNEKMNKLSLWRFPLLKTLYTNEKTFYLNV